MDSLEKDLERELGKPGSGPDSPIGVVGMTVDEQAHAGEESLIEYTAIGTAIARLRADDPRKAQALPSPIVVVPLDV
jgi:hypothetical protein